MLKTGGADGTAPRGRAWLLAGLLTVLAGVVIQPIVGPTAGAAEAPNARPTPAEQPSVQSRATVDSDPIPPNLVGTEPVPVPAAKAAAALDDVECVGNGTSGKRVQLVYAYRAGSPNRFGTFESSIMAWAGQLDDLVAQEAAATGGNRRVRFVLDGTCRPTVLPVRVASTVYDFDTLEPELQAAGLTSTDRKYMVYADWNVTDLCGRGHKYEDDSVGPSNDNDTQLGYAMTLLSCWDFSTSTAALHELFHNLGAVQASAPNSNGHHCNDGVLGGADIMC